MGRSPSRAVATDTGTAGPIGFAAGSAGAGWRVAEVACSPYPTPARRTTARSHTQRRRPLPGARAIGSMFGSLRRERVRGRPLEGRQEVGLGLADLRGRETAVEEREVLPEVEQHLREGHTGAVEVERRRAGTAEVAAGQASIARVAPRGAVGRPDLREVRRRALPHPLPRRLDRCRLACRLLCEGDRDAL